LNHHRTPTRLARPLLIALALGAALLLPTPVVAQVSIPTEASTTTVYELSQSQVPLGEVGVDIERTADGYQSNSFVVLDGLLDVSDELVTRPDGTAISYSLAGSVQGIEISVDAVFSDTGVELEIDQGGNTSSFELLTEEPLYVLDNNFMDGFQLLVNALLASGDEQLEVTAVVPQAAALAEASLRATGESAFVISDDERVWATRFDATVTVRNQVNDLALWVDDAGEIALVEQTIGAVRFERRSAASVAAADDAAALAAQEPKVTEPTDAQDETAEDFLAASAKCVDVAKVQVQSTGETLQGLLSLPRGAAAGRGAPTLVLLPGSGAVDLRGNVPPVINNANYEQLANALGCRGYGVLRVAKLGIAPSSGDANAVTIDTYASNTAAWLTLLAETPGVDARRLGVIGHSEGGLVALYASATGVIEPQVVVLLATAGRPLDVLLTEQLLASARRGGADEAALARLAEQVDDVIAALKASTGTTLELEGELASNPVASLFAHAAGLLRTEMAQDPAELIAALDMPIVIFQGGKDLQVALADGRTLAAAAPSALLLELPAMSHHLVDVNGPAVRGLLPASDAVISPTLVEALATFLNGTLKLAR